MVKDKDPFPKGNPSKYPHKGSIVSDPKSVKRYMNTEIDFGRLLLKCVIKDRKVRTAGHGGAINVPRAWRGKNFRVIFIPEEDIKQIFKKREADNEEVFQG